MRDFIYSPDLITREQPVCSSVPLKHGNLNRFQRMPGFKNLYSALDIKDKTAVSESTKYYGLLHCKNITFYLLQEVHRCQHPFTFIKGSRTPGNFIFLAPLQTPRPNTSESMARNARLRGWCAVHTFNLPVSSWPCFFLLILASLAAGKAAVFCYSCHWAAWLSELAGLRSFRRWD